MRTYLKKVELSVGTKRGTKELENFLSGIRPEQIVSLSGVEGTTGGFSVLIAYTEAKPQIVSTIPAEGSSILSIASTSTNTRVVIAFDEEPADSGLASHINVYSNHVITAEPTVVKSGLSCFISGVITGTGTFYDLVVKSTLPFKSGKTLGRDFTLSFKTAS